MRDDEVKLLQIERSKGLAHARGCGRRVRGAPRSCRASWQVQRDDEALASADAAASSTAASAAAAAAAAVAVSAEDPVERGALP